MFNLIKKASAGTHKIEQDSRLVFEDFSEVYAQQLQQSQQSEAQDQEQELDSYELEDLRQEKRKLLQQIKELEQKAESIIANAHNDAKDIELAAKKKGRDQGYELGHSEGNEVGYREGLEEGLRRSKEQNEAVLQELKVLLESAEQNRQALIKKYQDDLKDIAIAVAEKVVHVSLKSSGDIIKRMILSATEGMTDLKWAKLYIAETDSQQLVQADRSLIEALAPLSDSIKVIVMPEEESGTLIIELPHQIIDASTKTQIENIRDILNAARR